MDKTGRRKEKRNGEKRYEGKTKNSV